ncbi:MAG: hypothetical protein JWR63_611 [Conexibacter sp.]|nr:hypothetical protein [Conexibacter sp.]
MDFERARALWVTGTSRLTDRVAVVAVLIFGIVLAIPGMVLTAEANPDGLYYEAQAAQLRGESAGQAVDEAFASPRAKALAQSSGVEGGKRLLDPRWEDFSAQFYQRRWVVPGLALGVSEITGASVSRAVQWVSMFGYALLGLALYGLLRRRFAPPVALITAAAALLSPPLYRWSYGQFVDSWGVLLEVVGLLSLVLVADRGLRWLPAWIASMAVLSVTRDATMVLGIAAVAITLAQLRDPRARVRNAWVVATGALAAAPALLIGGAPVRVNLAYVEQGYNVPDHTDWPWIASHYWPQLRITLQNNFDYSSTLGILGPAFALFLVLCVVLLVVALARRARGDAFVAALHGTAVGCVLLLLLADNPQGFRLELVFAPVVAAGMAWSLEALGRRRRGAAVPLGARAQRVV